MIGPLGSKYITVNGWSGHLLEYMKDFPMQNPMQNRSGSIGKVIGITKDIKTNLY